MLGIVEQSGGVIRCESSAGEGTTFRIFLPAITAPLEKELSPPGGTADAARGSEVVLLVEDEESIRKLARAILEKAGYVVLDAADGSKGLALCKLHQGRIDLLVTDVMMPELGGRELAEAALKVRPELKVLYISGHTEDVLLKEGIRAGAAFLKKPFTLRSLAQKVRDTLDA